MNLCKPWSEEDRTGNLIHHRCENGPNVGKDGAHSCACRCGSTPKEVRG